MTTVTHRPAAVSAARSRAQARAIAELRRAWAAAPIAERIRLARAQLAGRVGLDRRDERSADGHVHSVRCRECLRVWGRGRGGFLLHGAPEPRP